MRSVRRAAGQVVLGALLLTLLAPTALAQSAERPPQAEASAPAPAGLALTQPAAQVSLAPGMAAEGELRFTSEVTEAALGHLSVVNYQLGPDGPRVEPPGESQRASAAGWVSLEAASLTLRPGRPELVHYRVQVPPEVPPGDYSALVLLETDPPAGRAGIRLVVNVPGQARQEAELLSFTVEPGSAPGGLSSGAAIGLPLLAGGPVRLRAQVENRGEARFTAGGRVRLLDLLGREVASLDLPAESVLPGDTASLLAQWSAPPPLGLFAAHLDLETGGPPRAAAQRFAVLPLESGLVGLLFLLGVALLLGRRPAVPHFGRRAPGARLRRAAGQPARSDELLRSRLARYNQAPLRAEPALDPPPTAVGSSPDQERASVRAIKGALHRPEAAELMRSGQQLARAGYRAAAYRLFCQALEIEPTNEEAWLWRAGTSLSPEEAVRCLERVLQLDPDNPRARRGLSELQAGISR